MQEPNIISIKDRLLIGQSIRMSMAQNQTFQLWKSFRPRVNEITNKANTSFYSLQIYDEVFDMGKWSFDTFFEKWAAVEVVDHNDIPSGLDKLIIPGGEYAIFIHKGLPQDFPKTAHYIFNVWLPNSDYQLDHRPHFEILPPTYRPDDPNAEEEVWIPIK